VLNIITKDDQGFGKLSLTVFISAALNHKKLIIQNTGIGLAS
jgi:hypothetical protein